MNNAVQKTARHIGEEIAQIIGADPLGYLSPEHVVLLTGRDTGFCTSCFSGSYPTDVPAGSVKGRFEQRIHET